MVYLFVCNHIKCFFLFLFLRCRWRARAREVLGRMFFFFFGTYPRGSSVRVRFLRRGARGPLDPGLNAGVSVRPPAKPGSDTFYTRSRVHTPGEIATPTSTHHISNRIATRFRIAAPRSQPTSKRPRVSTASSNRIRRPRAQYKPVADDIGIKSHSTAASTVQTARK